MNKISKKEGVASSPISDLVVGSLAKKFSGSDSWLNSDLILLFWLQNSLGEVEGVTHLYFLFLHSLSFWLEIKISMDCFGRYPSEVWLKAFGFHTNGFCRFQGFQIGQFWNWLRRPNIFSGLFRFESDSWLW